MADETRIDTRYADLGAQMPVEDTIPRATARAENEAARAARQDTDDPDATREQIERTRARMSDTIDEIEDVLLRKKEEIQERLDVLAPLRERPMVTLGAVFGAGLLLGFLTGGGDEDEEDEDQREIEFHADTGPSSELWERRARRLLRIAREQESELQALRRYGASGRSAQWNSADEEEEEDFGALHELRDAIAERVGGFISGFLHQLRNAG